MAKFEVEITIDPEFTLEQKKDEGNLKRKIAMDILKKMKSNKMLKGIMPYSIESEIDFSMGLTLRQGDGKFNTPDDVKTLLEFILKKIETLKTKHGLTDIRATLVINTSCDYPTN